MPVEPPRFRYDKTGKCLDCGGLGGCHSLECAEIRSVFLDARSRITELWPHRYHPMVRRWIRFYLRAWRASR